MAGRPRVTVAFVHPNELSASFHACLVQLLVHDAAHNGYLLHDRGQMAVRCGTDGLVAARNQVADTFLDSGADWLLWVDSDMGFAPDSLDILMLYAHPERAPIVGGLCFAAKEVSSDGMGGFRSVPRPTIYRWGELDGQRRFLGVQHYPVNSLVRCEATGSAFVLIHRGVFQAIKREHGTFYNRLPGTDGNLLGEDISFCVRAGSLGFPVHVHTGVRTTHHKAWWVGEQDFWDKYPAPPASEAAAVIVPVMRRPQNAAPFMRSLRASTGLAAAYAVCDPDDTDTQRAWLEQGANVLISTRGHTFAQKANHGYLNTTEPWLLFVGDDVRFHPGWLDHAQHVANIEEASLVATNDLGNRAVLAGAHATHPLIRRSYIDERGASWDGPGVVAHEGYRHWYVDNEWTAVAQQRGVFAAALGSKVEHLHPLFGKGDHDDIYRKGQTNADRDKRLWEQRLKQYGQVVARAA